MDRIKGRGREPDRGFTLIELLVVVIILGVLASIAIPIFYKQRERGWDAAVKADLRNAATAQETYLTEANPGPFALTVAELQDVGFRPSAPGNYWGDAVNMTVSAEASTRYCLTARAKTGNYFALSSDYGWRTRATPIDTTSCL
jgi:prepilin-type N-terminal cleavage/methylation domain-containing protein